MAKRNRRVYSPEEKRAFKAGMAKQRRLLGITPKKNRKQNSTSIKNQNRKVEKPTYLGPTCVNGEFWDTNFKKPHKFTKEQISELHEEYCGSDAEVVDQFVHHMRRKYGSFDSNGKFLGLLVDDE